MADWGGGGQGVDLVLVFNLQYQAEGLVIKLFGRWMFPWLLETKPCSAGVLLKMCQDAEGVLPSAVVLTELTSMSY